MDTKIAARIKKQIESCEKKIAALSGDYLTNTYKRQREQEERERKKDNLRQHVAVLTNLLSINEERELFPIEKAFLVTSFRDTFRSYNKREGYQYPDSSNCSNPGVAAMIDDSIKKLQKAGLTDFFRLEAAVQYYGELCFEYVSEDEIRQREIKRLVDKARLQQKGDIQFTPSEVAKEMVRLSHIQPGDKVAELSAGVGHIADEIRTVTENVDCAERMYSFREILELKGHNLIADDAFSVTEGNYDAIIINPPFSQNQDTEHVRHAYNLLKEDGTLVALTSPHWTFASDKKSVEFRDWVAGEQAYTRKLSAGTFENTGVNSIILVIEKKSA